MKNENLALVSAIALIVALLAVVTVLLVAHIITLDQVGPFLIALVVPLTAITGLPIIKAALAAPSPEQAQQIQQQSAQLHTTLNQAVQSLAQATQPAQVQPIPIQVDLQGYNAPSSVQPHPAQPAQVPQQPFPPLTVPMAAMPKQ